MVFDPMSMRGNDGGSMNTVLRLSGLWHLGVAIQDLHHGSERSHVACVDTVDGLAQPWAAAAARRITTT